MKNILQQRSFRAAGLLNISRAPSIHRFVWTACSQQKMAQIIFACHMFHKSCGQKINAAMLLTIFIQSNRNKITTAKLKYCGFVRHLINKAALTFPLTCLFLILSSWSRSPKEKSKHFQLCHLQLSLLLQLLLDSVSASKPNITADFTIILLALFFFNLELPFCML